MIEQLVVIGNTAGMEELVSVALRRSRGARCFRRLDELWEEPIPSDCLLILQHWPDEYSPADIEDVLEAYPVSRLIVSQGPWCASYGRTRRGWPAAVCVPVGEAVRRLDHEIEVLQGRRSPLPWTAGLDEIFAFDYGRI